MQSLMQALQKHVEDTRPVSGHANALPDVEDTQPERLTKILYREDRKDNEQRGGTTIVHASSTLRMPPCSRAYYLMWEMKQGGAKFTERIFGSMRLVWAYGRAAESHVRKTLLSDPDMRADAYGKWRCVCRKSSYQGRYYPQAKRCTRCAGNLNIYDEALFIDSEYGISGNPDFMFLEGARYRVVEVKSIKGEQGENKSNRTPTFRGLEAPIPDHVGQGTHYVRLADRAGLPVHRRPLVLYVTKGFETRHWYKPLIPNDSTIARAEAATEVQREAVRGFRQAMRVPLCPPKIDACKSNAGCHQKSCPAWAECMARKDT